MDLEDRLITFVFGMFFGGVIGYIVCYLRTIKEELDEVYEIEKGSHGAEKRPPRDEAGITRYPVVFNATLAIVFGLTLWASISTQKVNNDLKDQQAQIQQITKCNAVFQEKTIEALNERTTYAQKQADSNVKLQKAQSVMLGILLHRPPFTQKKRERAIQEYLAALKDFIKVSEKQAQKVENNPYPTTEEFTDCLQEG